ncbi:MAG TPA: hypothetical protein VF092_06945 [Longimicrobium sp.]
MSTNADAPPRPRRRKIAVPRMLPREFSGEASFRRRFIAAGMGALAPILVNLLVVDPKTVFVSVTLAVALGYAVKTTLLFMAGGAVAWMHPEESSPRKLFQMGIAAPALLTAVINGTQVERRVASAEEPVSAVALLTLASPAHAETQPGGVLSFRRPPEESVVQQLWRGFTGSGAHGPWFVCLRERFDSEPAARQAVARLAAQGVRSHVYGGDGPAPGYVVVVAGWLNGDAAREIQRDVTGRGVDTYVWSSAG